MWLNFEVPASSSRRRIYSDGKPHALSEAWRRWGWLASWVLGGLLAVEVMGVICLTAGGARWLQSTGFLLMLVPVILVALAMLAGIVALGAILVTVLRRSALARSRGRYSARSR